MECSTHAAVIQYYLYFISIYTYETQQIKQVQNVLAQKRADGHNFGSHVNRYILTNNRRVMSTPE